jgi:hypothetical protein
LKLALETAHEMQQVGLIGKHAIIGSVAVIYYAGPISTDDLDICFLHELKAAEIFSMKRIYEYLLSKGFQPVDFTVLIGGVKVQFIPSTSPLSDEAVLSSQEVTLFGVSTRVVTPVYLLAMKLEASRPKDYAHILFLLDNSKEPIDLKRTETILSTFGLVEKWNRFLSSTQWKPKP